MKTLILLVFLLNGILYISCHYSTESIPCDPVILSGNSGSFASPNHPDNYFDNQECTWSITVDEGRKIELKISSIDIEACSGCECDVLKIYDGSDNSASLLKTICTEGGSSTTVTSSSNVIFVEFSTDTSETETGFKAQYEATCIRRSLMKDGDEDWFNFFDTPTASPVENALLGSGDVYKGTSRTDVTFTIEGTKLQHFLLQEVILFSRYAKVVKFTFVYNVKKPKQIIYDGADTSANLLKQICYEGNSTTVQSSSNLLFVVFSTDSSVTGTGFTADYEATCLQRSLMKSGDEKWFNFFDTPKAYPVENALLGSGNVYKGPSSSDVTFTIEGSKLEQFLLEEAILLSRYAKEVKFTFIYNVKKPKKNKMFEQVIKKSKKWTPIKIKNHKKEMEQLLITFIWDSLAGKKGKKVQVRGMKVTVCA